MGIITDVEDTPNSGAAASAANNRPSEHGVVVRRALRYGLQDIPVLDDLAVLQAEEVRRGGAAVFGRGLYQAVRHDHVALGDGAPDLEAQLGELLHEAFYELDERLEAV